MGLSLLEELSASRDAPDAGEGCFALLALSRFSAEDDVGLPVLRASVSVADLLALDLLPVAAGLSAFDAASDEGEGCFALLAFSRFSAFEDDVGLPVLLASVSVVDLLALDLLTVAFDLSAFDAENAAEGSAAVAVSLPVAFDLLAFDVELLPLLLCVDRGGVEEALELLELLEVLWEMLRLSAESFGGSALELLEAAFDLLALDVRLSNDAFEEELLDARLKRTLFDSWRRLDLLDLTGARTDTMTAAMSKDVIFIIAVSWINLRGYCFDWSQLGEQGVIKDYESFAVVGCQVSGQESPTSDAGHRSE